jgi:hypothetical protein
MSAPFLKAIATASPPKGVNPKLVRDHTCHGMKNHPAPMMAMKKHGQLGSGVGSVEDGVSVIVCLIQVSYIREHHLQL